MSQGLTNPFLAGLTAVEITDGVNVVGQGGFFLPVSGNLNTSIVGTTVVSGMVGITGQPITVQGQVGVSGLVVEIGTVSVSGVVIESGVVIANQGSPAPLSSGWPVEITDGTNILGTVAHPLTVTNVQPITIQGSVNISGDAAAAPNQKVNQGVPAPLASGWPVMITDGTNIYGTPAIPIYTNLAQVGGGAVATNGAGVQKVAVVGVNGSFDANGYNSVWSGVDVVVGGEYFNNITQQQIASGSSSPLQLDQFGNLKITIASGVAGFTVPTSGVMLVNQGSNVSNVASGWWVRLTDGGLSPAFQSGASDGQSNLNVQIPTAAYGYVYNGVNWDRVRGDKANGILVSGIHQGQALSNASTSVVIASDQSAIPVTGTVTALIPSPITVNGSVAISGDPVVLNLPSPVTVNGAITISGSPTVVANAGTGTFTVGQSTGANLHVNVDTGLIAISGALPAGTNQIGHVIVDNEAPAANQLVNQGVPAALASGWPVEITDGTNVLGTVAHPVQVTGTLNTNPVSPTTVNGSIAVSGWFNSAAPTVGSKTSANSIPVVIASDQAAVTTSVNNFPNPITINGNANVSGWFGSAAPTVGSKTSANSLPMVIASDQANLPNQIRNQGVPAPVGSGWYVSFDMPTADPYSEVQFSGFNAAANSNFTVVAGTAAQSVRVFRLIATSNVQTNLIVNQAASNGAFPTISLPASGTVILDPTNAPWFTTPASSGFIIRSTAANTTLNATVYYIKS